MKHWTASQYFPLLVAAYMAWAPAIHASDSQETGAPVTGVTSLTADVQVGIEKALPRVNQCMSTLPYPMLTLGFFGFDQQGGKPDWMECLVIMPNAEVEPHLEERVFRDILAQVRNAKAALIFFERDSRIHLYTRDRSGHERYFVAPHPPAKSDLKAADFKPEPGKGLPPPPK